MSRNRNCHEYSRRGLLKGAVGLGFASVVPAIWPVTARGEEPSMLTLIAKSGKAALQGDARAETAIWGYNGMSPGPILRVRQGGCPPSALTGQIDLIA